MRIPVGYNQSFLEAYYPNETAYLPAELRSQLHILGTPPEKLPILLNPVSPLLSFVKVYYIKYFP